MGSEAAAKGGGRGNPSAVVRVVAQAPCWEACEHFGAHRVVEGMQCLSADRLKVALDRAIGEAASHYGVGKPHLERMFDRERASALLAELREHHPACEQMARSHGASLTSFVVERVTISAGAVAYLSALAGRFSDDEFIAGPVRRLGALIAQWDELLDGFADRLDSDASLGSARRRKLAMRAAAGVALASVLGALAVWAGWSRFVVQRSQQRLQQELDTPDPCAVSATSKELLRHARPDQMALLEERKRRCEAVRARLAHEEACSSLASRIETGKWEDADAAVAGASAALLRRIASRTLIATDLIAGADALPCQDAAAGSRFWSALASVAAGSPALWETADRVSPRLIGLLATPELALSAASREVLVSRAESISRRAIVAGLPDALDRARSICGLQAALRVPSERGCKAVERLSARK